MSYCDSTRAMFTDIWQVQRKYALILDADTPLIWDDVFKDFETVYSRYQSTRLHEYALDVISACISSLDRAQTAPEQDNR